MVGSKADDKSQIRSGESRVQKTNGDHVDQLYGDLLCAGTAPISNAEWKLCVKGAVPDGTVETFTVPSVSGGSEIVQYECKHNAGSEGIYGTWE